MTSLKIQLRESVIIANRKDIMLNFAHKESTIIPWKWPESDHYQTATKKCQWYPTRKKHSMRVTNEEVMLDYPRSTKWKMCCPHYHARDATLDALAATPYLRNRSLCPLCNKNDSIVSWVNDWDVHLYCFVELSLCLFLFWIFVMIAMILWGLTTIWFSL